jgi:hypothetical protein
MFRSYGKEMDSSGYFTLYGLGKIAESLKKPRLYRQLSRYDMTLLWDESLCELVKILCLAVPLMTI